MATISTNTTFAVSFTDEEKEILQQASEICKNVGQEIWDDGDGTDEEDETSFFFSQIGEGIQNILSGNYYFS